MEKVRNRKSGKSKNKPSEETNTEHKYVESIIEKSLKVTERQEGDGESIPENHQDVECHKKNDGQEHNTRNSFKKSKFRIRFEIDLISMTLFFVGLASRMYKLEEPKDIVFDELHYGKYVSLYMKNTFFFDAHPPLGKQLVAAAAYLAGFDGNFKFERIGNPYVESVPLFALRFVPALFGSLIVPVSYHLLLELGLTQWTSLLAGILFLCDNAILTQSRFILMESILLFFVLFGVLCILKFRNYYARPYTFYWFFWLSLAAVSLTCGLCVKYTGFYACCLALVILGRDFWKLLANSKSTDRSLLIRFLLQAVVIIVTPLVVYLSIFYVHLNMLYKAGPHDSIMTSAFQASLEGGLASITKGQPLVIAHGSQVTLRHTHGRTCWLHSHAHVYPIRYPDKRGSSHQQQVTCYSFKDVNNWFIVKRPNKNDLVVEQPIDAVKHGDVIQLVHGITSRALNSHDVAAAMTPHCQEVSCYIDYNVSMPAQNLWRVEIVNREQNGDTWHTIASTVRFVHANSTQALRFSGRQLPDWGFNQHEVVADRIINQDDTVWNVEEHRYTKSEDQKERERDMVTAEMIPTTPTTLSFWSKFTELQSKMLFSGTDSVQNHMYSSEPLEWPLMSRGIAYWVSNKNNAQIHLLGNLVIWYSASLAVFLYCMFLVFYLLRRRRQCFDLDAQMWDKFLLIGDVCLAGYLLHFLPYFFVERTLFLHHYLPAFTFKVLLLSALIEHIYFVFKDVLRIKFLAYLFVIVLLAWLGAVVLVFKRFTVLSYGTTALTTNDILHLRLKDTWDFIIHK